MTFQNRRSCSCSTLLGLRRKEQLKYHIKTAATIWKRNVKQCEGVDLSDYFLHNLRASRRVIANSLAQDNAVRFYMPLDASVIKHTRKT